MIIGIIIVCGALAGLLCSGLKGSGYGVWWDAGLGVAGAVMAGVMVTVNFLLYSFAKAGSIGLDWHSLAIIIAGACAAVYGAGIFKKISLMEKLEKLLLPRHIRPA